MADVTFLGAGGSFQRFLATQLAALGHGLRPELEPGGALVIAPFSHGPSRINGPIPELSRIQQLPEAPVQPGRVILLSHASVYGEGDFHCGDCGPMINRQRQPEHLAARRWEALCPICGEMLMPDPIVETSEAQPTSVVGRHYRVWEKALEAVAPKLSCPVVTLRLFHPYWPDSDLMTQEEREAVSAMSRALLSDQSPLLYEDGNQMRDLTHGEDVAQALHLTLTLEGLKSGVFNIASGEYLLMHAVAGYLQDFLGKPHVPYEVLDTHQDGDARHRLASIARAVDALGYQPRYGIVAGLERYCRQLGETLSPKIFVGEGGVS